MARRERIPLLDGEGLIFELREHGSALVWPSFILILTTGIGSFLAGTVPDNGAQTTLRLIIAAVAAAIILRWSVWPFLAWYGRSWVLTTRRLILREGVLSRKGIDVPLTRVIGNSVSRTVLQRMFRSGRLVISTAGPHGDLVIENAPMVAQVSQVVSDAVAHSGPAPRVVPGVPGTAGSPTGPLPGGQSQQPFPPQQYLAGS
jgi:uncharacterized membrane protein YdbT with pleckstrin-like domain